MIKIIKFKNGKYAVAEGRIEGIFRKRFIVDHYLDRRDTSNYSWSLEEYVIKYCLVDSLEEAKDIYNRVCFEIEKIYNEDCLEIKEILDGSNNNS